MNKFYDLISEPKRKNLNVRVGSGIYDLINKEANANMKTKSDWVIRILLKELQRKGRI